MKRILAVATVALVTLQTAAECSAQSGQLFPYDQQDPWLHGFFQEVPAFGGYASFRPYNYKHSLSQSRIATSWGMPGVLPYSQQFWHRYSRYTTPYRPYSTSAHGRGTYGQSQPRTSFADGFAAGNTGWPAFPGPGTTAQPVSTPVGNPAGIVSGQFPLTGHSLPGSY